MDLLEALDCFLEIKAGGRQQAMDTASLTEAKAVEIYRPLESPNAQFAVVDS